ncbi:NUDIX hydrolase [Ancylobacter sp. 6x-1]|uniref:NUDIX hydrolase n=1 Tax=Ancylobacter crimeensis TaxID=2579147 RepID=A0ABT0DA33_9HYPH|nr:NUDIX hydrolase [Ancylobacter crimeensis]
MPLVRRFDRLDLRLVEGPWAFAQSRRAEIDAHFAALKVDNPALWNGRILMLGAHDIDGAVFNGRYVEADFASLLWWRDTGYPDPGMRNAFAMGALRGSDGGYILGRMAPWTANAGRIYFAAGTPDLSDVKEGGIVDLHASVLRELGEETGLSPDEVEPAPVWHAVFSGPRIAFMLPLLSPEPAERLAERIRANLAREERPELDEIVVARSPADLSPAMPDFIAAYLTAMWTNAG